MKRLNGHKSGFLAILAMILLLATAAAARTRCEVTLRIFEFKEDGSTENFPVTDADVAIFKEGQEKPIRPKLKDGQLVATLNSGVGYAIEIGKPGFMTTKDTVECYADETAEPVSPIFFIWAGDPKQFKQPLKGSGKVELSKGETTSQRMTMSTAVSESGSKNAPKKGEAVDAETTGLSDQISIARSAGSPVQPGARVIFGGVVNGKAANLVKPPYPAAARAVRASGAVNVQVTIDELGYVVKAAAVSGHPLLRAAAIKAARESKFATTMLGGYPVKVTGIIVYNFQP